MRDRWDEPRRVLITGASGFLGSNVALGALAEHQVIAHSRSRPIRALGVQPAVGDLREPDVAAALVQESSPDIVVNCAALADVDACERDQPLAGRMNVDVPGELAAACARVGARFVHISTDAVFGRDAGPSTPDSDPGPVNHYGVTKLQGEQRVLQVFGEALVLRTNIVGWSPTGTRSLLEFFHDRLSRREQISAFADVLFRPMAASDVWGFLEVLLPARAHGVWHATGSDLVSKHDFAVRLATAFNLDTSCIRPCSVADANLTAVRATCMDVTPSDLPEGSLPMDRSLDGSLNRLNRLASSGYRSTIASFHA